MGDVTMVAPSISSGFLLAAALLVLAAVTTGEDTSCLSSAPGTPCCCCHCAGGSKCAGKICCYPDDECIAKDGKVWKPKIPEPEEDQHRSVMEKAAKAKGAAEKAS